MPKYLFHGSYTIEGVRGLLKEGGSARSSHLKENISKLGGQVEAVYFAFGGEDLYAIIDLPDNIACAAHSLAAGAGGGFRGSTILLLTPEEIDQAIKKAPLVGYHPAGQS